MTNTRNYTEEFKAEAIQLAIETGNTPHIAKQLGIPYQTLYNWVKKSLNKQSQTSAGKQGNLVDVKALLNENKQLKQKLARSEQEKNILKKAAAYFAQETQ